MNLPEYQKPDPGRSAERHEELQPVHADDITGSGLIAAVRRAYRDTAPNRSVDTDGHLRLHFHTDWYPADSDTIGYAIGYIGQYNRFDPDEVADTVQALPGGAYVAVARERSPALYIQTTAPYDVVTALRSLHGSPDELSVRSSAQQYPNPEPEFSNSVWCAGDDPDLLRFIETPALVRAWWD